MDPLNIKEELLFNQYIWYEDGNCLEWYDGMNHNSISCDLEDAFVIAQQQKSILIIQPELQDQCIFADFSE